MSALLATAAKGASHAVPQSIAFHAAVADSSSTAVVKLGAFLFSCYCYSSGETARLDAGMT